MDTLRSGGAGRGGERGVVEVEREGSGGSATVVVLGRNWKSERRRSAHLLAEKWLGTLLAPPLTAASLVGFLVGAGGGSGGLSRGLVMPMLKNLRDSISAC